MDSAAGRIQIVRHKFTREMMHNLERAMDHPDMTPELATLLSTSQVELEYEIQSGVEVRE